MNQNPGQLASDTIDAALLRQHDVEDREGGRARFGLEVRERGLGVEERDDVDVQLFEQPREQLVHRDVVVHHQRSVSHVPCPRVPQRCSSC